MSIQKQVPGYETHVLVPAVKVDGVAKLIGPDGLEDYDDPSSALLNYYQAITAPNHANGCSGGNISCAILNDLNLGLTDSDTDDARTVCSKGQSSALTFYNFDDELNLLRDESLTANGQFNLARDLVRAPGLLYFHIHRVIGGKDSTEAFATGDEIDMYLVETDNSVPGYGDGSNQTAGITFIPKNEVNIGHVLTA